MKLNSGLPMMPRPVIDSKNDKRPPGARFERINDLDTLHILALAQRAKIIALAWRVGNVKDDVLEANPGILEVDFAVVHLCRKLDLRSLLLCNELDFISEHATIQKHIDRSRHFFPESVPLRFASVGAKNRN